MGIISTTLYNLIPFYLAMGLYLVLAYHCHRTPSTLAIVSQLTGLLVAYFSMQIWWVMP
ncbi:hypothetical protein [Marinobacter pelagius]|uniref:Uncharacterized protein n=1 Tax=Marinobacter pelagius TaxID=379482 RepID=A0A1I4T6J3_9GAMM|nr:hypothetical protein [Marinobacter pelagius]SFM72398.1 hypothetical protein SAMN04487961_1025 [Marinobacter pelagius]